MERTSCLALPVGRISEVCRMCTKAGFSKEFPLLQQIHMGGGRVFAHNWFMCNHLHIVVSRGGGVYIYYPIYPAMWFSHFQFPPGFGDVLMVSYVVSICAFDPFLLPISSQGLKFRAWILTAIHGQFLKYGKFGAWILTIYSHSVVSLLPFKSFYPSHHVSVYFSGYFFLSCPSILSSLSVFLFVGSFWVRMRAFGHALQVVCKGRLREPIPETFSIVTFGTSRNHALFCDVPLPSFCPPHTSQILDPTPAEVLKLLASQVGFYCRPCVQRRPFLLCSAGWPLGVVLWVMRSFTWKLEEFSNCSPHHDLPNLPKYQMTHESNIFGVMFSQHAWQTWNITFTYIYCNQYQSQISKNAVSGKNPAALNSQDFFSFRSCRENLQISSRIQWWARHAQRLLWNDKWSCHMMLSGNFWECC